MAAPRNYWMLNIPSSLHESIKNRGFDILVLEDSQKKRAQRMEVGDRVLFYVSEICMFVATATVDSEVIENSDEELGIHSGENNDAPFYPWRVDLKKAVLLRNSEFIDARLIAPRLQYIRKWTPEHWPLAFQGPLHLIPKEDFQLLEAEMRKRKKTPTIHMRDQIGGHCAIFTYRQSVQEHHRVS